MPIYRIRLATIAFSLYATLASAEFKPVETEIVPVERLTKNLEEIVQRDPKNAKAVLNLARIHAMAYSLCSEVVPVRKEAPEELWLGYPGIIVPFTKVVQTKDPEKLKAAKAHLDAAIRLYGDAATLAPNDLTVSLGHAWLLTQLEKKTDAIAALRSVIKKAWEEEKNQESARYGGHMITSEAGDYLLPLLDAERDKDEIAVIKTRKEKLGRLSFAITPVVVPLKDGLTAADLEDCSASVEFNVAVFGAPRRWTWTTPNAAWLVWDPRHEGRIRSGLQLFGNATFWLFWDSGYDALAALDDNHDGQLSGRELEGLALWHDANGNGISEPGEVRPLSSYGIVALSCASERLEVHPDRIAWSPAGVLYRDGRTRPTFDLVLHSKPLP